MNPQADKERVREATDIVDVVSKFVALKPAGRNFKGLCPFHQEKTPSFIVNPERQSFKCFGCGAGGDVYEFLMRVEGITFGEALRELAQQAHISLSPLAASSSQQHSQLAAVMHWASTRFRQALLHPTLGQPAREYLQRRGISPELAEQFEMGYAPPGWDNLIRAGQRDHFSREVLIQAGLLVSTPKGEYDRFRSRVIFPIHDLHGSVVAFGGRTLGQEEPKYLNSPETELFHKGSVLFGLHLARARARHLGWAVLVEGYMDVLACHAAGVSQAVASMGTALTPQHVQLLKRYVKRVLLAFDSDEAGIRAAERAAELFIPANVEVLRLQLQDAKDPDAFVERYGGEAFQRQLEQAVPIVEFILQTDCQQKDTHTVAGKMAVVKHVGALIRRYPPGIERQEYIHQLAERLHVEESLVAQEIQRLPSGGERPAFREPSDSAPQPPEALNTEQETLLSIMLRHTNLVGSIKEKLSVDLFSDESIRTLFSLMMAAASPEPEAEEEWLPAFISGLRDPAQQTLARRLAALDRGETDPERVLIDCLNRMEQGRLRAALREIQTQIQSSADQGDMETLKDLQQTKKKLESCLHHLGVLWR